MGEQWRLAEAAGIDAFCVYHYWFDGRRLLEAPLDGLLRRPEVPFRFYLCWANEAWRRNWDGLSGDILMPQSYGEGFEAGLAASALPYFADPRYARPDGRRPRFVIYRPTDLPDPAASVARLRAAWAEAGHPEVELGAVLFHVEGESPVEPELFDFWIEMPPHGLVGQKDYLVGGPETAVPGIGPDAQFRGLVYDYEAVIRNSLARRFRRGLADRVIAGVMPSWDNSARRKPRRPYRLRRQPGALQQVAPRARPRAAGRLLPPGALRQRLERMGREGDAGAERAVWRGLPRRAARGGASRAAGRGGAGKRNRACLRSSSTSAPTRPAPPRSRTRWRTTAGAWRRAASSTRGSGRTRRTTTSSPAGSTCRAAIATRRRRSRTGRAWPRACGRSDGTVLVSSEEFSRSRPSAVDMRELRRSRRRLRPPDRVVCVLRNQLAYLQSIYLQVTKGSRARLRGIPRASALREQPRHRGHARLRRALRPPADRLRARARSCFLSYEAAVRDRAASSAISSAGSACRRRPPSWPRCPPAIPTSRPSRWPRGPPTRSPAPAGRRRTADRRWRRASARRGLRPGARSTLYTRGRSRGCGALPDRSTPLRGPRPRDRPRLRAGAAQARPRTPSTATISTRQRSSPRCARAAAEGEPYPPLPAPLRPPPSPRPGPSSRPARPPAACAAVRRGPRRASGYVPHPADADRHRRSADGRLLVAEVGLLARGALDLPPQGLAGQPLAYDAWPHEYRMHVYRRPGGSAGWRRTSPPAAAAATPCSRSPATRPSGWCRCSATPAASRSWPGSSAAELGIDIATAGISLADFAAALEGLPLVAPTSADPHICAQYRPVWDRAFDRVITLNIDQVDLDAALNAVEVRVRPVADRLRRACRLRRAAPNALFAAGAARHRRPDRGPPLPARQGPPLPERGRSWLAADPPAGASCYAADLGRTDLFDSAGTLFRSAAEPVA